MKNIDKVIKNGKVAVAYSPGFGAGWTTWNSEISPFEPKVIKMIQQKKQGEINEEWCEKNLGIKNVYCGGADELTIEWIPRGERFYIDEYDGSESIVDSSCLTYQA